MGWRGILGFDYGVVQAPLGPDISGPDLVAAVANAGAIGLLRAPDWSPIQEVQFYFESWSSNGIWTSLRQFICRGKQGKPFSLAKKEAPEHLRELIRKTRALTDKPFGVAIVLAFPHKENVKVVLEEKVALLQVYWGEYPKELVSEAHVAGVKVIQQVGCFEEAKKAKYAGVDAIIVQGHEAGGHVIGQSGLISLLPRVADLVSDCDILVIAAGGIVDARGYAAALTLGAHGVCLGTRFLATVESFAHPHYKQKLLEYEDTEYTNLFGRSRWPGAPHRVLQTPFFIEWRHLPDHENEEHQPVIGHSVIHGVPKEIRRFAGTVPNATTTGNLDCMVMYAGEGVGLIKEILPAGEVVKKLVEQAQDIIHSAKGFS